jgi:energy-coupling factor transport system permease protein
MNAKMKLFSYNSVDTPIHRLSGLTKLVCFLLLTFAVMFSYDIRVILAVMIFSVAILRLSQIRYSQIRLMIIYVLIFVTTNAIISFFFSPEQGVKIYGTRHDIVDLYGDYKLTWEQIGAV